MDGRIGQLSCQYQMLGDPTAMAAVQLRLDRLMRTDVVKRCEAVLDTAFANDPTVYIIRQLNVRLTVADGLEDSTIVKHWGEQIVRAIVEVTDDADDTQNLVTFRDQADYVAHFLIDLARGQAWNRWFYGFFAGLQSSSFSDAFTSLVDDNRVHFGQIIAYLHQYDALHKTLSLLDTTTIQNVWASVGGNKQDHPAHIQPLFALAFRLVESLGWWKHEHPDEHNLFETYIATNPSAPDWRDHESLLQAVIAVIVHLNRQGLIRFSETIAADQVADLRHQYDWLDFDNLLAQLSVLQQPVDTDLPLRITNSQMTPRQRSLLQTLASVLQTSNLHLDSARLDISENAIRLMAALLTEQPQWSDDNLTINLIENLIQIWALVVQTGTLNPANHLSLMDIERLLSRTSSHISAATHALHFLKSTGEIGLAVIQAMLEKTTYNTDKSLASSRLNRPAGLEGSSVETACAGSFLLLRAVLDARLPMLLDTSHYPTTETISRLSAALLTLGLYWSGGVGLSNNRIDPALLILAGLEKSLDLSDLQTIWQDTDAAPARAFQNSLLRTLSGQRVMSTETLTVHRLGLDEHRTAWVAGADTSLWPFNTIIHHQAEQADVLANWLNDWEAATGQKPTVIDSPENTENSHLPDVIKLLKLADIGFIEPDLTMILTANALLRMWARWLGQFAQSSIYYLLDNFIRRPGKVTVTAETILVELDARPLDIVLQMAGYLSETGSMSWLGNRRLRFQIRERL